MKAPAAILMAVSLILAFASASTAQDAAPAAAGAQPQPQTAMVTSPDPTAAITEEPYLLTWQKDPRFRARDPFDTVLHTKEGAVKRQAARFTPPRTPGEETAFVAKIESYIREAAAALEEADYKAAKDRLELVGEMIQVPLTTQPAKDKLATLSAEFVAVREKYTSVRARAALTEALQLAARMQAYFESDRYGEVISTEAAIAELDTPELLGNPEVAQTAAEVLGKCAELKRRAEIHIEFTQMDLTVDAISHFPEGRSFAIVNGEVFGEGLPMAPELTIAAVDGSAVVFDYRGERISLGLAEAE